MSVITGKVSEKSTMWMWLEECVSSKYKYGLLTFSMKASLLLVMKHIKVHSQKAAAITFTVSYLSVSTLINFQSYLMSSDMTSRQCLLHTRLGFRFIFSPRMIQKIVYFWLEINLTDFWTEFCLQLSVQGRQALLLFCKLLSALVETTTSGCWSHNTKQLHF